MFERIERCSFAVMAAPGWVLNKLPDAVALVVLPIFCMLLLVALPQWASTAIALILFILGAVVFGCLFSAYIQTRQPRH